MFSFFRRTDNNMPVHIVLMSNKDYKKHEINVLRDCASVWSNPQEIYRSPFGTFSRMLIDADKNEFVYFINTTRGMVRRAGMEYLIDNEDVAASSYMPSNIEFGAYNDYDLINRRA